MKPLCLRLVWDLAHFHAAVCSLSVRFVVLLDAKREKIHRTLELFLLEHIGGDMTEGELDYSYILEQLSKTGYDKYFGLEFFTFENREEKVWKSAKLVRRNRELRQELAKYFAEHRNS